MEQVRRFLPIVAMILIAALAWHGQSLLLLRPPAVLPGIFLLLLSTAGFLWLSLWISNRSLASDQSGLPHPLATLSGLASRGLAALKQFFSPPHAPLLLGAAIVCGVLAFRLDGNPAMHPWPVLLAWLAGIGFFLVGAWAYGSERETTPVSGTWFVAPFARWEFIAIGALTLAAFLLRVVDIGNIPNNISADEAEMGLVARHILQGKLQDPFATSWLSHPNLWFFLQALSLKMAGDTVGGLRMLSVVIGTVAIPMMYLFARPLYGRTFATIATALLVAYHFHLHYSRYALNNIADPLLALAFFTALFHGLRTRHPLSFALAGVVLGLALHFYMGSRLLIVLLFALLLHQFFLNRANLLRLRWQMLLLAVGFFLAFGPLLQHFLTHTDTFNARFKGVGVFSNWFDNYTGERSFIEMVFWQFRVAFGAYLFVPDTSCQYDPGIALLDPLSGVLFLFGIALAIVRWRRVDSFLLLAWVGGAAFFGGVLLANTPESGRYVTTGPALCLLVALAVVQMATIARHVLVHLFPQTQWEQANSRFNPQTTITYGVQGTLVALLVFINLHFYFNIFTPRDNFGWTEQSNEIGHYLARQPENTYVYFFGAPRLFIKHGPIRFFAPDVPGIDVHEPITTFEDLSPTPAGMHPVYVFLPGRENELQVVQTRYPEGEIFTLPDVEHRGRGKAGVLFLGYRPDVSQRGEGDDSASLAHTANDSQENLIETYLLLDGDLLTVRHSESDMGLVGHIFDGDPKTLLRGKEANPFIITFAFSQPRTIGTVGVQVRCPNFSLSIQATPKGETEPRTYTNTYLDMPEDSRVDYALPDGPLEVEELRLEIMNLNGKKQGHVHLWEVEFQEQ